MSIILNMNSVYMIPYFKTRQQDDTHFPLLFFLPLGFALLGFLHFLQTTHNSLSCCLFGWLLLRVRLFLFFSCL